MSFHRRLAEALENHGGELEQALLRVLQADGLQFIRQGRAIVVGASDPWGDPAGWDHTPGAGDIAQLWVRNGEIRYYWQSDRGYNEVYAFPAPEQFLAWFHNMLEHGADQCRPPKDFGGYDASNNSHMLPGEPDDSQRPHGEHPTMGRCDCDECQRWDRDNG